MRVYLSAAGRRKLTNETKIGTRRVASFEGMEIRFDDAEHPHLDLPHFDPMDPATISSLPIGPGYIDRVTYVGRLHEGFRPDGLYKFKGATARVETKRDPYSSVGVEYHEHVYQTISISAGSLWTLRQIYTQVRQGKLDPIENWGGNQFDIYQQRIRALETELETTKKETLTHLQDLELGRT